MKILAVADIHCAAHQFHGGKTVAGINTRAESILEALKSATAMADNLDAQLVVAGDLFDKCTPDIRLVSEVRKALGLPISPDTRDNDDKSVTRPVIISGNHDAVSSAPNDHALGCLYPAHVAEPGQVLWSDDHSVIYAGYEPGIKGYDHLQNILKVVKAANLKPIKHRLLVIHLGIEDENTPPWLKDSQDSIKLEDLRAFCKEIGVTAVAAGNWHQRKYWGAAGKASVLQVGALVPTGFDNEGLDNYGTAALWDSDTNLFEIFTIPSDRFVKLNSIEALDALLAKPYTISGYAETLHIRLIVTSKKELEEANLHVSNILREASNYTFDLHIDVVLENKTEVDELRATTIKAPVVQEVFAHHASDVATEAYTLLQKANTLASGKSSVKVSKIKIKGAGKHNKTEVLLPSEGLVLFTGANGAGKSTIIQAVPLTLWDSLAIDRPPIWTDQNPKLTVEIDGVEFTRTPNQKPNLSWTDGPKFDRKGDAAKVIESQFGSLENWIRFSLIDGSNKGYLTSAGPTDRRRILSSLCNLDTFDVVYANLTKELAELKEELHKVDKQVAVLESQLAVLNIAEPEKPEDNSAELEDKIAALKEAIEDASNDYRESALQAKQLRDRTVAAKAIYLKNKGDADATKESGVCPTCGQPMAIVCTKHPVLDLEAEKEKLKQLIEQLKLAEAEENGLAQEISNLETKLSQLQQTSWSIKNLLEKYESWQVSQGKIAQLWTSLNSQNLLKTEISDEITKKSKIQHLFSPNGPRGELLERYCEALSNQATEILQMADGPEAFVTITVAKKGIEIISSLGPSPSRGEQRKLDIVLALSAIKIGELLNNSSDSTLFIDESFEIVDGNSIESLAKIFEDVAKTRCVVIIAHAAQQHFRGIAKTIYEVENSEVKKVK